MNWQLNFGYQRPLSLHFLKVVSEIQVILWLKWKIHKFTPWCANYEACVGFMRHTNTML